EAHGYGSNLAGGNPPHVDQTLQHPRCVFQLLKRHYSRYTPELVEQVCGVPKELFLEVAGALCDNSGRDRTAAFCYAVGWTQHSVGVQYIRTAAIVQLLLGNIGRPGGGILALRGHASIQGSTDVPTLYDLLPGYIPMPKANTDVKLKDYLGNNGASSGWWTQFPKYAVSLLKAWFGDAATKKNGTFTNTQRLLQWHHKAVEPPGDCRSDLHFTFHLGKRLKELYADSEEDRDRPVQVLTWEYPTKGEHEEPDAEAVLREMHGSFVESGELVSDYKDLADDGATACGVWVYW